MQKEFYQTVWGEQLRADWEAILQLAVQEDLGVDGDWTTNALVDKDAVGAAAVVARKSGVVAGLPIVAMTLAAVDSRLHWIPELIEGQSVGAGSCIGVIRGPVRGILSAERIVLNMLCRLSGVASLTRKFVDAVAGTKAKIYDTRKTTPGWRRLEKYAVRCGGGRNHRGGLSEAALIKDNHLAWGKSSADKRKYTPAESVRIVRDYIEEHQKTPFPSSTVIVEVEVDTLEQLQEVLPSDPDIVLLDNMPPAVLREAVALRDRLNAKVELEASGGLDLQTIRAVAESGIERISVGALTHSAPALDIGLDWKE